MEWRMRQNCPYSPKKQGGLGNCEAFDPECLSCTDGAERNIFCNIFRQLHNGKIQEWTIEKYLKEGN